MDSEKSTVNDLQASKPGGVTSSHISQIPGLSTTVSSVPEERARGRRARVMETDSDYVKLAKQGGHKGLLWHEETTPSKPNDYKPPDWFCSPSEDDSKPSEEKRSPGASKQREPPFGTDSMSVWERDDSNNNTNEKNNNAPCSQLESVQLSNRHHETGKFRRIVFDKKPAPVNMSKLLSFGYAEDNKAAADVSD